MQIISPQDLKPLLAQGAVTLLDVRLPDEVATASLPGAVLAGYLIGAATVIMQVVLPPDARPFRDAFVYGAVIAMLIWRPNGLFTSKATKQRV